MATENILTVARFGIEVGYHYILGAPYSYAVKASHQDFVKFYRADSEEQSRFFEAISNIAVALLNAANQQLIKVDSDFSMVARETNGDVSRYIVDRAHPGIELPVNGTYHFGVYEMNQAALEIENGFLRLLYPDEFGL